MPRARSVDVATPWHRRGHQPRSPPPSSLHAGRGRRVEDGCRHLPPRHPTASRRSGVAELARPILIRGDHLGHPIWPTGVELCGQPRLEGLDEAAGLEPSRPISKPNPKDSRPRSLMKSFDRTHRLNMGADPVLCVSSLHPATMAPTPPPAPGHPSPPTGRASSSRRLGAPEFEIGRRTFLGRFLGSAVAYLVSCPFVKHSADPVVPSFARRRAGFAPVRGVDWSPGANVGLTPSTRDGLRSDLGVGELQQELK